MVIRLSKKVIFWNLIARVLCHLKCYYKICERYIHYLLIRLRDKFLTVFISAYRKDYSTNNVLIGFIENWKQSW